MKFMLPNVSTDRLDFRIITTNDFDLWLPLFTAPDVAKFLGLDEKMSQRELCEKWFDKVFHRYENDLGGMNALIHKTTGKLVGQCGLLIQEIEEEERMEVGYSVLPEFWGMGYASEAAQKCKEEGFKRGFTNRLMSVVHVDNIGSELVAKRNGMTYEKTIKEDEGNPFNVFSIQKSDWEK